MKDAKNFLRFILPGITSVILLLIALIISDYNSIREYNILIDSNSKSIGIVIGLFLTSGGLGYIYSQIYWGLYWFPGLVNCKWIAIDLLSTLRRLEKRKIIIIVDGFGNTIKAKSLTKRDAWTILTLHSELVNRPIKQKTLFEIVIDRVVDISHSLGATIIGMIIAFIVWFIIHFLVLPDQSCFNALLSVNVIPIIILWPFLIILFIFNRYQTLKDQQEIYNTKFIEQLNNSLPSKGPIEIIFVKSD